MRVCFSMRTTLTIDDDLAAAIEQLREERNLGLRAAIDQLLRAGLESVKRTPKPTPYQTPVFEGGLMPGIDPNRMNQLVDELEVEEHLRDLPRR